MSEQPKVSIITTMYNHEAFIGECIESVQQSKFTDYEHILVDDCSKDKTREIANNYARKDNKIKVITNQQNLGDYPNRNEAAKYAKGQYIKYVDGDDMIGPWVMSIMVDSMDLYPEAAAGLFVYGKGQSHLPFQLDAGQGLNGYYKNELDILNRSPLGAIIRKSHFLQVNGFPNKKYVGDFELWIKLNAMFPIVALPASHAYYRTHPKQESSALRDDYSITFNYYRAALDGLAFAKNLGVHYDDIESAIHRKKSRTIFAALKHFQFKKAYTLKTHSEQSWTELLRHATG